MEQTIGKTKRVQQKVRIVLLVELKITMGIGTVHVSLRTECMKCATCQYVVIVMNASILVYI